jgi:hypothetical protein
LKDWLKEKCPWHLDGNHSTEQCNQLRRALKDTPDPRLPHDKKGKRKDDKGNNDFQKPDKTVNVLFGGLPTRQSQKATRWEVFNIEPTVPIPSKVVGGTHHFLPCRPMDKLFCRAFFTRPETSSRGL